MASVEVRWDGDVARIWLNRPERLNAVAPVLVEDLLTALDRVAGSGAGAVVLGGRGRAFCAGHDLKEAGAEGDDRRRLERLQDVTRRLRALPQPVIAAVHGYAIGAGAEFALGCDLVLAAEDAVFAFPEAGLGLSVTGAASRLLPLLVGPAKAKELLLLGERIDAATAERIGLVNAVATDVDATAMAWARKIAGQPSATLAKRALDAAIDLEPALELEVSHALLTDHSPAAVRAAEAFRSRR
jgi:2-(1,2-epoxy-1,2-dihydrophenyl)acetyl-CoA isomerase